MRVQKNINSYRTTSGHAMDCRVFARDRELCKDNHARRVGDVDSFFAFQRQFFLTEEEDLELLHRHDLLKSPGAVLVADNVLSTAAVGLLWRTGRGILHMRVP